MEYIQNSLLPYEADVTASTFELEVMAKELKLNEWIIGGQNVTELSTTQQTTMFYVYTAITALWITMTIGWAFLLCIYRKKHNIRMLYMVSLVPISKCFYLAAALVRFGLCGYKGIQCTNYSTTYQLMYYAAVPYYGALSSMFMLIALGWGTTRRYISCVGAIMVTIGVAIAEVGYISMILLSSPISFNITLFIVGVFGYIMLYKQVRLLNTQTIMYKHIDPYVSTKTLPSYQKYFILKVFIAILGIFFMLRFLGWIITWVIEQFVGETYSDIVRIIAQTVLDEAGELICVCIIGITIRPRNFKRFDGYNHASDLYGVQELIIGRNRRDHQRTHLNQTAPTNEETTTSQTEQQEPVKTFQMGRLDPQLVQTIQTSATSPIWRRYQHFQPAVIVRHAQRQYPLSIATVYSMKNRAAIG